MAETTTAPRESVARRIATGTPMVSLLSVVLAIVIGGILMAVTNPKVATAAGYFFARPSDTIAEVFRPYAALIQGSIFNWEGVDLVAKLYPLAETLTVSTPLILAGLGVAIAFRRAGVAEAGGRGPRGRRGWSRGRGPVGGAGSVGGQGGEGAVGARVGWAGARQAGGSAGRG
ncbi:hypothetical protein SCMU_12110 [Sinomonas cyclohexanicum]|uniref:Uncharacterized protein n=1 Tax=Sinomonas cyclohexanicum TaxID=322009 RepID=A0ABN6FFK5_SINCY|nr:hypothetical protein [Corynebacterium cyclohexanicum]BCT75369.1 hypothetical protein SCMU_12110 [Corynebacterium cyclohexanicum]